MQKKSHLAQKSYGSTFCDMSHHTRCVHVSYGASCWTSHSWSRTL